mmetsp:Transcript_2341/g.4981  ORF Transcript_2341/g.4981 Transcript_2341/m.4981 type:complete len:105 (-) Transcript_2341:1024-1338(-)
MLLPSQLVELPAVAFVQLFSTKLFSVREAICCNFVGSGLFDRNLYAYHFRRDICKMQVASRFIYVLFQQLTAYHIKRTHLLTLVFRETRLMLMYSAKNDSSSNL